MMKICKPFLLLLGWLAGCLHGQTIEDGIMIEKHRLFAGNIYSHDSWDRYWQGSLNRENGNIGTLTTQTNIWSANYGVTSRLSVISMVPYVWTNASQGVLHGMKGFQDLTLAAKYSFVERPFTKIGWLRGVAVGSGAIPLTDYQPDFLPLSIGSQSKRISGRLTLNFQANRGWFVNGSGAYTWRSDVTLDRPYYYTDNKLYFTNIVDIPGVFDYVGSAGYLKRGLLAQAFFGQQRTQGGGDIRRQDAPFISHRMNFTRVGAMVMYPIPKLRFLAPMFGYTRVVQGRNVGQASVYTIGLMYSGQVPRSGGR
jgi:hypothetical protein